ncbi:MAG: class I SAM-dependent methyltransferase [Candidatus Babeliales bacterium]|jgi:SAM-dependent methyltransferase
MSKDNIHAYGQLCGLFYDATEKYASEQEVDFFISFIQQYPGRVLEAMSGSGRLQIPLIKCGYVVDGVDHSYAMLARCRQRCASLGLEPELYEQSLENLALPHTYNTVIIAFGSLQLISDRDLAFKALKNLNAHMLPGGNLLIDIFVPDITIDEYSISTVRLDEHKMIRLKRRHIFDEHKKIVTTFSLFELIIDGTTEKQENELIELVWRSDKQWQELLLEAGFEIVQIYDERFKESEPSRVIHARSVTKN